MSTVKFRPGALDDSYQAFLVFEESLADLLARHVPGASTSFDDPGALARMWEERRSLYEHLARTAFHFWVAEEGERVVGYARSILRDDLLELTELFVSPSMQSAGIGKELLRLAFPDTTDGRASLGATQLPRSIIASPDMSAQALYMRAGVYPRVPLYYFWRKPEPCQKGARTPLPNPPSTDLEFVPLAATPEDLVALGELDRAVLGHRRDADHLWLLSDREGYLYLRDDKPVGYGYVGLRSGPFALLDPADFPAVLAHAESRAALSGQEYGFEVPMINSSAASYLLARGFRIQPFPATIMSDLPFGRFDRYIVTAPPFFL